MPKTKYLQNNFELFWVKICNRFVNIFSTKKQYNNGQKNRRNH